MLVSESIIKYFTCINCSDFGLDKYTHTHTHEKMDDDQIKLDVNTEKKDDHYHIMVITNKKKLLFCKR